MSHKFNYISLHNYYQYFVCRHDYVYVFLLAPGEGQSIEDRQVGYNGKHTWLRFKGYK